LLLEGNDSNLQFVYLGNNGCIFSSSPSVFAIVPGLAISTC
jgi:hypothetical protein